ATINNNKAYAFSYPTNVNDIGDAKKNSNKKSAKPFKSSKKSKKANSKKGNSKKKGNSNKANSKNKSNLEPDLVNDTPTTTDSVDSADSFTTDSVADADSIPTTTDSVADADSIPTTTDLVADADSIPTTTDSVDLVANPTDFVADFVATTSLFTTTKATNATNAQYLFPEKTPTKEANAKFGNQDASTNVDQHNDNFAPGTVAGIVGAALLAFGLVGLFIHRKVNAGKKKDIEKDIMSNPNDAFDNNNKPPGSSQFMEANNDENIKETSYDVYSNDVYSNEMNIPSIEPLSPLQLSPNNVGSQLLNEDPTLPIIPPLVFANNTNNHPQNRNASEQSSPQPPVVSSRQSFYGESLYSSIYTTMTPSLSSQDPSQSKGSFVDLSRSTAYPVPFVAVSTTSDINNYDNIKETDRYSIDSANLNDVDNYILEPEHIRPDSSLLTDLMNSPLDEKAGHQITNNSAYEESTNDKFTYLPTNSNDMVSEISLSNPVVPTTLSSNIKDQPFSENTNNIHQDSENKSKLNNAYTNQNIQMDYVQPNQGTIHIETLDLNITDSTVAPAKESLDIQMDYIQPNQGTIHIETLDLNITDSTVAPDKESLDIQSDISNVTNNVSIGSALSNIEDDFNDVSSPETPVEKPKRASIQIMKTEIVPVQSNMQIEKIQDIVQKNSENTNDPSSDTDSPSQTSEADDPLMMTPATTVFVKPIQSKMKVETVNNESQLTLNKPFISTPSAYIAERASAFTQSTPTTTYKKSSSNETTGKPKKGVLKNKGGSSAQVDDGLNKVESDNGAKEMKPLVQKKPAHRDSDQEPKSILKNKKAQDIKIANDLMPPLNTVEKSETQYRSPTFSMYKMYDDLPGGRNSTMQPNVPELPSSRPDNTNSNENDNYESCTQFLLEQAKEIGLKSNVFEYVKGKPIVLLTWEGRYPNLPSILLNSHTDVVPVFEEKWSCKPFEACKLDNGDIVARGAQDMKCVGASYLEAIRYLKDQDQQPCRTIHLSYVPDEEIGGEDGMGCFIKSNDFKKLNVGFALDEGIANPNDALREQQMAIGINTDGTKYQIGDVTTVNLTMLKAGVQHNVVPEEATAGFDIRITPKVNLESFKNMMEEFVNSEPDNIPIQPEIFPAATDSRYLRGIGIPALGVSYIRNTPILLHDHDERINENLFLEGIEFYKDLINHLANIQES
ncbi:2818_t:CDS:10, partial [Racocetra fulgida]